MHRPPRPELLALLSDVKDHPDDRTPWLVLTDWLEEHGDEADRARAEYCRLCLPKMGLLKVTAAHYDLGERRRELFRQWGQTWLGPLFECRPQQENGLFTVNADTAFSLTLPNYAVDVEPFAWVYQVVPAPDAIVLNATSAFWGEVRSVHFPYGASVAKLLSYLQAPHLRNLRQIRVAQVSASLTSSQADELIEVTLRRPEVRLALGFANSRSRAVVRIKERLAAQLVLL
jgi:uncharacterized protein (TIGR02996 family)